MDNFIPWRLIEELDVVRTSVLIAGYDPAEFQDKWNNIERHTLPKECFPINKALMAALKQESIKGEIVTEEEVSGYPYDCDEKSSVILASVGPWLQRKGYAEHFFFLSETPEIPIFDEEHPHYSPRLAAAVKVWLALEDTTLLGKYTPKHAAITWLKKNAEDLGLADVDGNVSDTALEGIATIAHWRPKGGAPKTVSNVDNSLIAKSSKNRQSLGGFKVSEPKTKHSPPSQNFDLDDEIPF